MTPHAILFDLDDTIFDQIHSSYCGLREAQTANAILAKLPLEQLFAEHAVLLEALHLEVLNGTRGFDDARIERFRRLLVRYGGPTAIEGAAEAAARYRAGYQQARQPVPGAIELLTRLHGVVAIVIVSNNMLIEQQGKLRSLGIEHLIDALIVSEVVGSAKPQPAIFQAALDVVSCAAADVIMVGDSWQSDIVGAHGVGIRAFWLNRHAIPIPDPAIATELLSLEPTEVVATLLLGEGEPRTEH